MNRLTILSLILGLSSLGSISFSSTTNIISVNDLITLRNNVNNGKNNYTGTTVLLTVDITLSDVFEPIGLTNDGINNFQGTFDGQGHTISNLVVNTSQGYAGLFGVSTGTTIKNIVLDDSCSITCSCSDCNTTRVGGIIGFCQAYNRECIFDSIVNMASVTFTGITYNNAWLGGIVGEIYNRFFWATVKNCVNYGDVTQSGNFSNLGFVAGIVGECYGDIVQNCINYGTINSTVVTERNYVGGIIGISWQTQIENCVGAGKIVSNTNSTGSILGEAWNRTSNITHCYWTSDVGWNVAYGAANRNDTFTLTESFQASLNSSLFEELNRYSNERGLNKWVTLHLNGGTINGIGGYLFVAAQQQNYTKPTKEGREFIGWYTDAECSEAYNSSGVNITDLYAGWSTSNVMFIVGGNVVKNETPNYGSTIFYPNDPVKEGYTFSGWSPNITTTPAYDINITALWTINNYTLTFIFDNGIEPEIRILNFSQEINYPNDPVKEGYTFSGWSPNITTTPAYDINITALWTINNYTLTFIFDNGTEPEIRILNFSQIINYPDDPKREGHTFNKWDKNVATMPANDLNITAQWLKNSQFVEIIFDTTDLTEPEIFDIINQYTDTNFVISKFEYDSSSGSTQVIVKFNDSEGANKFVHNVNDAILHESGTYIKEVTLTNTYISYSHRLLPLFAFMLFYLI